MRIFTDDSPMPRLLALDASTEACSVAYGDDSGITESCVLAPREHMQRLLPMVDEMLAARGVPLRDLDAIAFARGPGSFTGLRICLGVVQGLAFGAELPVIPVSTLAALAQTAVSARALTPGALVLAAIDARMDEVYWAWFEVAPDGLVRACGDEHIGAPESVTPIAGRTGPRYGVGSGWNYGARMPASLCDDIDAGALPGALAVARLALPLWRQGATVAAEQALPVYLRDNVAWNKSG